MTVTDPFRFSLPVEIRYADIDSFQHVNNATYFTYMETARIHYLMNLLGWDGQTSEESVIVAKAICDYAAPIRLGDTVRAYVRTTRIGTKSFDLEYVLRVENEGKAPEIAAKGMTVMVSYDYERNETISVPERWREAMVSFEPGL